MPFILITSLATAAGLALFLFGLVSPYRSSRRVDAIDDRVAFYGMAPADQIDDELVRLSFYQRIIEPPLESLHRLFTRLTSVDYIDQIEADLLAAGNPSRLTAPLYLLLRVVLTLVFAIFGVTVGAFLDSAWVVIIGAIIGFAVPWIGTDVWLRQAIAARRRRIRNSLPDVIDFLVVAVDAGLAFDNALNRVVTRFRNPLTEGFQLALAEVQLGRGRLEALEAFGHRIQVPEVSAFVAMVVSSERLGVPIGQALRIQAADLRWRRSEWAREEASKAPVRMTIPMVVLIFPTLWIILLGPSLIRLLTQGL